MPFWVPDLVVYNINSTQQVIETEYMVATSGNPNFEKSPAVQTMEAFIKADKQGNTARARLLLADDVVMLIRGKSLLAGEHRGPDAANGRSE